MPGGSPELGKGKSGLVPSEFIHLGIAHAIVGKYFQALKVHRGMKHIQELSFEKGQNLAYSCIL